MIRLFDILFSFFGLIVLSPLLIVILIISFIKNGSPIFVQKRIGRDQEIFSIIKFRTMKKNTKTMPSHFIRKNMITTFGFFLRRNKLDELPQLFNVLIGDMSLVGPRPCLLDQKKLIIERKKRGVFKAKPGMTGLAQISGITMNTPIALAKIDAKMNNQMNIFHYFNYILRTILLIIK